MSKDNNGNNKKNQPIVDAMKQSHNGYYGKQKAKGSIGFNQATKQNKNYRAQNRGR